MKLDEALRDRVISTALAVLDKEYVFGDSVGKIEKKLRANVTAKRYDVKSADKLAKLLTDDVNEQLKAGPLRIEHSEEAVPEDRPIDSTMGADERTRMRMHAGQYNAFIDRVERLAGNIGYIRVSAIVHPLVVAGPLAAAMSFVADTEELVIDLRTCGGNAPETVALMASYLFDAADSHRVVSVHLRASEISREYWTLPDLSGRRFTKPVYVLVNAQTLGSAEDFAAFVQSRKRGKIVGEPTAGATFDYRRRKLAANFALYMPVGKSSTKGPIKPDVKAPDALDAAHLLALKSVRKRTDAKKMPKDFVPNFSEELDRVLEKAAKKTKRRR